jgi:hypothetical protein
MGGARRELSEVNRYPSMVYLKFFTGGVLL